MPRQSLPHLAPNPCCTTKAKVAPFDRPSMGGHRAQKDAYHGNRGEEKADVIPDHVQ